MVIAERFAWAHLPKAGGDATQTMFTAVRGLVRFAHPQDSNDKHDAFWQHEDAIAGKLRVMNIRRLPSWVLSAAHHRAISGLAPDFVPGPMLSVEEMTTSTDPDDLLRWMTDGPRLRVERWLRTEHLADDVDALLEEVGARSRSSRRAIRAVPRIENSYDHDVTKTFTAADIRRMYEANPGWAAAEVEAFGEIHELAAR